jgi:PAS domain S-box-containing protein
VVRAPGAGIAPPELTPGEAEIALASLADVFFRPGPAGGRTNDPGETGDVPVVNSDAKYRTLIEQLPAVVFMAYLDRGIGEAYVSPRIEEVLGFSQVEWLEDPVRWFHQIHPDDQRRWSVEAAEMFLTGRPLRSAYRVLARDGRVIWFQCEAKMVRRDDGRPWFIHGVGFDITELKRMEQAVVEVSAREQRQIAQDLHDGLGQHLTGIAFMSKVLEQKLADGGMPEAAEAAKIVSLVNEAIHKTRELARGLLPVVSDANGLVLAITQWAREVEDLYHIRCDISCVEAVDIDDVRVATHLYHIAHEAVNNALRHGQPTRVSVSLARVNGMGALTVEDDGIGLPERAPGHAGLGLHIMSYRADIIGGSLDVRRGTAGGTVVRCQFPLHTAGATAR